MSFSELLLYMIMVNSFPKKYFKFSIKKISPKQRQQIRNQLKLTIFYDLQYYKIFNC